MNSPQPPTPLPPTSCCTDRLNVKLSVGHWVCTGCPTRCPSMAWAGRALPLLVLGFVSRLTLALFCPAALCMAKAELKFFPQADCQLDANIWQFLFISQLKENGANFKSKYSVKNEQFIRGQIVRFLSFYLRNAEILRRVLWKLTARRWHLSAWLVSLKYRAVAACPSTA